jgi:hypothetical protein
MKSLCGRVFLVVTVVLWTACGGRGLAYAQTDSAPADPDEASLAERSWSIGATPSLRTDPPPFRVIEKFIQQQVDTPEAHLCSFQFDDLAGDGTYQLVVSMDSSGRRWCNTIFVVARTSGRFKVQELDIWTLVEDVESVIVSLTGDGRRQLVIPELISGYAGGNHCMATWPVIYTWDGTRFARHSRDFPSFYEQYLQRLDGRIKRLTQSGADLDIALSCLYMEHDKILRALGTDPHAGFERSRQWLRSETPELRLKAIKVLMDIADGRSIAELRSLEHDRDPIVAQEAKNALASIASRGSKSAVHDDPDEREEDHDEKDREREPHKRD